MVHVLFAAYRTMKNYWGILRKGNRKIILRRDFHDKEKFYLDWQSECL